ncbi:MAG: DEAD/DEAH box helicase [Kordiimonadaceae bacterium]|nr:DEAD/DEAH box helicase [Kordiimonadaceae bacterium]
MGFERLGLSDPTLAAVADAGYSEPTPIQAQAIPQVLMGRDILGIAQTGTGKTASFTLPMIDILSEGRARARMPRSLILEPTRELAAQVAENFEKYGKNTKLSMALLIGGVNFTEQEKALDRGVDVLIATPGRLLDHFSRGKLLLNGIDILVVDEADRMLDMGFIPDVEKICERITKNHQTLFFSATMPPVIQRLTKQFLDDPKKIEVARPASTSSNIEQFLIEVSPRDKRKTLRQMLREEKIKNGIIFCNRKRDVKEVFMSLERHGFSVGQLHGDMEQSARMEVLRQFKENEIQLLCASDVAARGLDVPDVSHVFNFDVPGHAEDYVHRIGRTGRAGRQGKAITITTKSKIDVRLLEAVEKLTNTKIARINDLELKPEKRASKKTDKQADDVKSNDPQPSETDARESKSQVTEQEPSQEKSDTAQNSDSKTEKQARPSRRQGRSNDRNERGGRNASRSNERSDRPERSERSERSGRYTQNSRDRIKFAPDDMPKEPFIGLGPHVPAFLVAGIDSPKK